MATYTCMRPSCGAEFNRRPAAVKGKKYIYCGTVCRYEHKKEMPLSPCISCGGERKKQSGGHGMCSSCYDKNRPRRQQGSEEHQKATQKSREYYKFNRDRLKHVPVEKRFGISKERYQEMLEEQEYRCAICKRHRDEFNKNFAVDHDHSCCPTNRHNAKTCGKCVRRLLCEMCNKGLGLFNDDPELLLSALKYLRDFRPVHEDVVVDWLKSL